MKSLCNKAYLYRYVVDLFLILVVFMYLSSSEIFKKLSVDSFLNNNLKMREDSNTVVVEMRVGGFFCSLLIFEGNQRVIKISIENDYSKKLIKELFNEYENLNIYDLFSIKHSRFLKFLRLIMYSHRLNFALNDLCQTLKGIYQFLFENVVKLNSVFRLDNAITNTKNTQVALDISNNLSVKCVDMMKTMDLIFEQELSIARYGDGELNLVCNINRHTAFQRNSFMINHKLSEILATPQDGLLVCNVVPLIRPLNSVL